MIIRTYTTSRDTRWVKNFVVFIFAVSCRSAKTAKICTPRKFPAIRYTYNYGVCMCACIAHSMYMWDGHAESGLREVAAENKRSMAAKVKQKNHVPPLRLSVAPSSSRHIHSKAGAPVNGHLTPHHPEGQFTRGAVVYLRLHNFLYAKLCEIMIN